MNKLFFLVFLSGWLVWGILGADDMTLMKNHEIAELVDEYDKASQDDWENDCSSKLISIVDINGNIIRQTTAGDDYPIKNPSILEEFLKQSLFLLEINGTHYYLYEFPSHEKKNFGSGNFFSGIFI